MISYYVFYDLTTSVAIYIGDGVGDRHHIDTKDHAQGRQTGLDNE
jgi:hypothetical protein